MKPTERSAKGSIAPGISAGGRRPGQPGSSFPAAEYFPARAADSDRVPAARRLCQGAANLHAPQEIPVVGRTAGLPDRGRGGRSASAAGGGVASGQFPAISRGTLLNRRDQISIVTLFMPSGGVSSNAIRRWRCENHRLARQISEPPLASGKRTSPRLRRPRCRGFELGFDLNRPIQPRLSTSSRNFRKAAPAHRARGGRTCGRDSTVEVEHVLESPPDWPRYAATPLSLHCRRPSRILTGEPTALAPAPPPRIRAREAGRHEDRNRQKYSDLISDACISHRVRPPQ